MYSSYSSKVAPWIERLILRYNSPEEGRSKVLKAHVIGTGQMTQSQAQTHGSDSPVGLLFLSDDVVRIPATLTADAWERLQIEEERESLTSLLNTTVRFCDYQLQFHMAAEETKCNFFLSVGKLEMASVGPNKVKTPCCTTLPSVRLKIYQMWSAVQEQDVPASQASQNRLELTELLTEWQLDCMQTAVEDVTGKLVDLHGRSSECASCHDCVGTRWDADRVRYKGERSFTVPPGCLLIPEAGAALQIHVSNKVPDNELPGTSNAALRDPSQESEATQASVDPVFWRIGELPVLQIEPDASHGSTLSTEEELQQEDVIVESADSSVRPSHDTWDVFPQLRPTSSSSDASPLEPTPPNIRPDLAGFDSPQVAADGSKRFVKVSESGKEETSFLTPYQKGSPSDPASAVPSTSAKASGLPNRPPATEELCANAAQDHPPSDAESPGVNVGAQESKCRKAKRKREEVAVPPEEEDVQLSSSPPSWLCSTLVSSMSSQDHQRRASALSWASAKSSCVHSDGTPFYYSYSVTGQNLVDLSHFKVSGSCLQWAIRYLLVPKQTDNRLHT